MCPAATVICCFFQTHVYFQGSLLRRTFSMPRPINALASRRLQPVQDIVQMSSLRSYTTATHLSHIDECGRASMVDVGDKFSTKRSATASGRIFIPKLAYDLVTTSYPVKSDDTTSTDATETAIAKMRRKGDALTVAQLAAIMGAKQTSALIPLCHPLPLSKIDVKLFPRYQSHGARVTRSYFIECIATVSCEGKTGVEMEALTAVSVGLLTVWDMLKAVAGKEMQIGKIMVVGKSGGRSGDWQRASL